MKLFQEVALWNVSFKPPGYVLTRLFICQSYNIEYYVDNLDNLEQQQDIWYHDMLNIKENLLSTTF